jgi:hypothetical protein
MRPPQFLIQARHWMRLHRSLTRRCPETTPDGPGIQTRHLKILPWILRPSLICLIQSISIKDWGALSSHTLFEDSHSNDELIHNLLFRDDDELGEPFEIVDCTTKTYQSRRVRTRRNICSASLAKNPEPKRGDNKRAARNHKAILNRWPFLKDFSDKTERDQNKFCATLSQGILPLGRCPSFNPANIEPSVSVALPSVRTFPGWKLKNSTLGRFDRS